MYRFRKIKITSEGKIHLQWQVKRKSGSFDDHSLESVDSAMPEFYKTMESLREHVAELCEFPNDDINLINVKSVSFSYGGENEIPGAVITASKTLLKSNAPLNINTPHKSFESYSMDESQESDPKAVHTDDCIEILTELQTHAIEYIQGKRQQQDLFSNNEEEKSEVL